MNRTVCRRMALGLALMLSVAALVNRGQAQGQLPEVVANETHNGGSVTLTTGSILVVRLSENPSTGYSRAVVTFPNAPIRLIGHQILAPEPAADGTPVVGAPRIGEWRFAISGRSPMSRGTWLKILNLRPFAKGVDAAGLWELKVTVPANAAG